MWFYINFKVKKNVKQASIYNDSKVRILES